MNSRLVTTLTGLVMSGTLALTTAGAAQAAGGAFRYTDYENTQQMLLNPKDGACYKIDAVGETRNGTNAAVELFTDDQCAKLATVLPPAAAIDGIFSGAVFVN
jgi:hypothetical protein